MFRLLGWRLDSMEESPKFQRALKEAADEQWRSWLYGGGFKKAPHREVEEDLRKIQEVKQASQKRVEEVRRRAREVQRRAEDARKRAEELRRMHNPMLKRITETLEAEDVLKLGLVCPVCGEGDKGNRMNKRPWCFKCNVPLIRPNRVARWVNVKRGRGLGGETMKKLRGLPDDGGAAK